MAYNDLSRDELLVLVAKLAKENEEKSREIKRQQEQIEQLEAEKKELNIRFEEVINKYEHKMEVNRKILRDHFCPKTERIPKENEAINEAELYGEEKKRKAPTERFIEELKNLQSTVVKCDFEFEENGVDRNSVKQFGTDVTYKIEIKSIDFEVVKIERPKYRDGERIYQSVSEDPYPHSPLTASFAANIIEMKYNLGIPLYRYAKYMNSQGLNVSVQDLSNYVTRTMKLIEPVYEQMERELVNTKYRVIHGDETELKVIDSDKSRCYVFVYSTSFWDHPVYIYRFSESRKTDNTVELLDGYDGYFECDGYSGYDALPDRCKGEIRIQRCWTHMRRYFIDCIKSLPDDVQKESPAFSVVKKIGEMFSIESMMRSEKYTKEEIERKRNGKEYKKIIKDLDEMILSIDYGSNLYLKKAVEHYKNDKDELYTFLEDGYVDISNNLAERVVKPFVIARKNFMFCKSTDGADTTAKLFSVMQTARANGVKSEEYLRYVIENIGKADVGNLMPWSEALPEELKIK